MKVIKPGKLGVLSRCFEHERRFYMGVSVLMFVPLARAADSTLLPEVGMWSFVADRMGKDAVLDAAIPKSRAEFLIHGFAFAPGGRPQTGTAVRARVGNCEKILHVLGDRHWRGSTPSDPHPFTRMPIDWAHAFGGPSLAENPVGKGADEVEVEGARIRFLPNVELPREHVQSPRQRPTPAGFMPIDISWPQRTRLAGTHDQAWLENDFPGFARDVDWGIHNTAPRDQQVEGWWKPGDRFELENLHPDKPIVWGELPAWRARAFVSRRKHGPARLDEVELALQTLWMFPDAEKAVLIFSGSTRVLEDDGADVLHLLLAAEREGEPRATAHYVDALLARLDKDKGAVATLRERELLPEGLPTPDKPDLAEDLELSASEGLLQQNMHRKAVKEAEKSRAFIAALGLDPDIHGPAIPSPPPPPPTAEQMPDLVEKLLNEAKALEQSETAQMAAKKQDIGKMVDELGIEGFDGEVLRREQEETPVGPPAFTAEGQRALLAGIAADSRRQGTVIDEIEQMIVDPVLFAHWQDAEAKVREGYRLTAHMQNPAPPMAIELREACRARVLQAIAAGESFGAINLTGADLSGMELAGADMTGAFLESAKLDGADLRGAKLERAVLAHASLIGTRLDEAQLVKANLGKTTLHDCSLARAELGEAIMVGADLTRANLAGAKLIGTDLGQAKFAATNAQGIEATGLNLMEADLRGVDLREANLTRANFLKVKLDGVDFSGAWLESCTFLACSARAANFMGATLTNARFVEGTLLDQATFTEADMKTCNLRGSSMIGCDLRRATLDDADLTGCNLHGAKLYQCVARRARFDKADLEDAELMSANLMHASLSRAIIRGADLRGANLYGADMARVQTDARVQLDEALLTKVRIHPRWHEQQEDDDGRPV
ncbi:DUF2169 family type VI secretion system accessory protein [Nannocystaceae bacterium ST9]